MFRLIMPLIVIALVPLAGAQEEKKVADQKAPAKEAVEKKAVEQKAADLMHPRVKMATSVGDIVLELNAEKAPITVDNFLHYAESKYYDGTIFHRVMSNFMIQGGGFTVEMDKKTEGLLPPIKNEWKNGLKNERGTISMARTQAPNSATSQFFINVVDNGGLDQPRGGAAYCVFGKVVEGLDVVDKIKDTEVGEHPKLKMGKVVPTEPIVIKSVTLLDGVEFTQAYEACKSAKEEWAKMQEKLKTKAEDEKKVLAQSFSDLLAKKVDEHGNELQVTESGLMYVVLRAGEGESPAATDTVLAHYTGWLLNGSKFDSSVDRGKPSSFPLNKVIKGWTEGVAMMKVGGKWRFIIPPEMAYGERGRPGIPPNSTLVFDVELLEIK